MHARALEFAQGDLSDNQSAFQWSRVSLNLPGSDTYNPALLQVRLLWRDGFPALGVISFFDDGRLFGAPKSLVENGVRQVTSRLQYLGIQDATRK
jgi:hypothetical protein